MKEFVIKVKGMMCTGCESRVQNVVKQIEGVEEVIANHKNGTVTIKSNIDIDKNIIKERIEDIGYEVVKTD